MFTQKREPTFCHSCLVFIGKTSWLSTFGPTWFLCIENIKFTCNHYFSSGPNDEKNNPVINPEDPVSLIKSIDAAWQKRGTGRSYNSLKGTQTFKESSLIGINNSYISLFELGHSTLIGYRSEKVLSYATRSKRCSKCEHNISTTDHDCRMNFTGSAKAMEPDMAVELVANNPLLVEANAKIGVLIADDDSSTLAAVRRESSHNIEKWSDFNHAKKGMINTLYSLKLPVKIIDYLGHCFSSAIKQNKSDVKKTRES